MIKALSAFWMFAIVIFHADGGARAIWYRELLSDCRMAGVGFFFVVSGYFLLNHYDRVDTLQWWARAVTKRIRSLLLPYFIWCVLAMLLRFAIGRPQQPLCMAFGITNVFPTANPPLWYIKFLFIFVLLSLAIIPMMKRRGFTVIVVGVLLLTPLLPVPLKFSFFFSGALFILGICLSLKRSLFKILNNSHLLGFISIALWLIIFFVRLSYSENVTLRMYSAYFAIAAFWYLAKVIDRHVSKWRVNIPTFFVFCIHSFVLSCIPNSSSIAYTFARGGGAFIFSVLIAMLIEKLCPRIYYFLTANR